MTTGRRPEPNVWRLLRVGLLAGVVAAVVTMAVAGLAGAAGATFEVQGEAIPLPAFALWSIIGGLIGGALARLLRSPGRFVTVAMVGTALSLIPPLALPDAAATKAVLVLTHLVAASIIIPLLRKRLRTADSLHGEARTRS